jgi:hypothetical protein
MLTPLKILKYNRDGTGRDSYIYQDNGGYYPKSKEIILIKDPGSFYITKSTHHTFSILSKPKKYNNNGTGRDSYI